MPNCSPFCLWRRCVTFGDSDPFFFDELLPSTAFKGEELPKRKDMPMFCQYYLSPIGLFRILSDGTAILRAELVPQREERENRNELTSSMAAWLQSYFEGSKSPCPLPLAPRGTAFQRRVWAALQEIPYGSTVSYGRLAEHIEGKGAARAVGGAVGKNPILIAIPCHRVVSQGGLGGFSALGGVTTKQKLMQIEGILPQ